jgi:hypothetical protein
MIEEIDEELKDLLDDEDVSKEEKKKIGKLLPNEVWQGMCNKCGKLAIRLFPARRGLKTIEKKEGVKGLMKACESEVKNQRVLISTPSFNLILTGTHREAIAYDLSSTGYGSCDMAVMVTDKPRDFVWHLFSRLRAVRTACLVNGIKYNEVKDWFDSLDDLKVGLLMPGILRYEEVLDADGSLENGPWYAMWISTDKISPSKPCLFSKDVNGDEAWDSCMDPQIDNQLQLSYIEYNSPSGSDNLIDAPKNQLQILYLGSTIYTAVAEPAGTPGKLVAFRVNSPKETLATNQLFSHFQLLVPIQYWMIEASRFRRGINITALVKTGGILDLSNR